MRDRTGFEKKIFFFKNHPMAAFCHYWGESEFKMFNVANICQKIG